MMERLLLVCLIVSVLVVLCAGPNLWAGERKHEYDFWRDNYFSSRVKDLMDAFSLKLAYNKPLSFCAHARACKGVEAGVCYFDGWKIGNEKCGLGVLAERKVGGGLFGFPTWMVQNVYWQTGEARERALFHADMGPVPDVKAQPLMFYQDENRSWLVSVVELDLPMLPGFEVSVDYPELADFLMSWIPFVPGLRVPEPFTTDFDQEGRVIPKINTIHWHGAKDAQFEKY